MKKCGIILLAVLTASGITAETNDKKNQGHNYSLDQIIQRCIKNYELLKISEKEIELYRGLKSQAGKWDNPELSASGGYKKDTSGGYLYGLSLSQSISWPGKKMALAGAAEKDREIAGLKHKEMQLFITHEVTRLAYRYNALKAMAEHAGGRLKRLNLISRYLVNRKIFSPDKIVEKNIILGRILSLEKNVIQLEQKTVDAYADLNRFVCIKSETEALPQIIAGWFTEAPRLDGDEIMAKAIKHNFNIRAARALCAREEKRLAYERVKTSPDINISLFFDEEHTGMAERSIRGGVSLPLPILDSNSGGIKAGKSALDIARLNLAFTERKTRRNVKNLVKHYGTASGLLKKMSIGSLKDVEARMKYADREFMKGRVSLPNYLAMDEQSHEVVENIYETQLEFINIYTALLFLSGQGFEEEAK